MQIKEGEIIRSALNQNSWGGTELIASRMVETINKDLLSQFQIVFSRQVESLDSTKIRIFYAHDLADDPQSELALGGGKWKNYHRIVFVSHYQMNQYIAKYNIPASKCNVMLNSIVPLNIELADRPERTGSIKIGYWSTPHRGLEILVPVFDILVKKYDIELEVFSSFELYGWAERDKPYQQLFDMCKSHDKINYHGTVSNQTLRESLANIEIMGYPSIWEETSCLCLMEAMSAGILSVHSNLGALYETAANWTVMYQYNENTQQHAGAFYQAMSFAIENVRTPDMAGRLRGQKAYADAFYNWNVRATQWEGLLGSMINLPRELPQNTGPVWSYQPKL